MDVPRATRPSRGRIVAGVGRGLAEHLRLPVWVVRTFLVVLALTGAVGLVLYAALWAVLPQQEDPAAGEVPVPADRAAARLLAVAAVVVAGLLLLAALGLDPVGGAAVPLVVVAVGAGLVWQQADDGQRARWSSSAADAARRTATRTPGRWRLSVGIGLTVAGLVAVLAGRAGPAATVQALAAAALLLAGVAVVLAPWAYRRWQESAAERAALVRARERADVAAHVHDSVLQTLTLIQRNADDPAEVTRLARAEERALRSWLYAPAGDPARFAARLQADAAQVEQAYAATMEVVTVGDDVVDAGLGALLAASREAMVNAARHGGGSASVYAEVRPDAAEVFVRDRGPGFDPAAVGPDRHGLRDSVVGRMARNGGTAEVVTGPGRGTEIRLRLDRTEVPA